MSTNFVEVVLLDNVVPHPNADRLEIAIIRGTTVVVGKGEFQTGQKVVYFPPDLLIPEATAKVLGVDKYLKHAIYPGDSTKSQCRIAACRLRQQPSFGFITSLPVDMVPEHTEVGENLSAIYFAEKYDPPVKFASEHAAPEFPGFHKYTDIEHYWRRIDAIPEGTPVRITEKLHGANSRVGLIRTAHNEFTLMAGSHKVNRKAPENGVSMYWEPLSLPGVKDVLWELSAETHSVILFGEIFGPGVQSLDYCIPVGQRGYRVFDISVDGVYLDWDQVRTVCEEHSVPLVPLLYEGAFYASILKEYTDGPTTMGQPASAFKGREGVVVTPLQESFYAPTGGRRIVKSVSADYYAAA